MSIYHTFDSLSRQYQKGFAILIDPDKTDEEGCLHLLNLTKLYPPTFFFVGGSLMIKNRLDTIVQLLHTNTDIPVVLFPGNHTHLSRFADAVLLLSLISGRNSEYLIGQHVIAAPYLKASGLEIIPTGYMLIDCGQPTSVSYMSNTTPIPYEKSDIAACTALAGEMLGLKVIYLDGGSGAKKPISASLIQSVRTTVNLPIIIGGGISTAEDARNAWQAGADCLVVGTAIENTPDFLKELYEEKIKLNQAKHIK